MTYPEERAQKKEAALSNFKLLLEQFENEHREPDDWTRKCLLQASLYLEQRWFGLAQWELDACFQGQPMNIPKLPTRELQKYDLSFFKGKLNELMASL
jgi:hypothetical protein